MTDSYKVQTSQLPNFPDENTKRDEKQENFFLLPDLFHPSLPPSFRLSCRPFSPPLSWSSAVLNFSSNFIRRIERAV